MRRSLFLLVLLLAACGPKPPAKKAAHAPEPEKAPEISSDVRIADPVIADETHRYKAVIPAGWTAWAKFRADASGPPPVGELRARLEDRASGCVVDLAVETAAEANAIARGREVFFQAETDEPRPAESLQVARILAATTVPPDPSRTDIGYWLDLGDGRWLRAEGRFDVAGVVPCKAKLDELVRSLSRLGTLENAPAADLHKVGDGG